MGNWDKWVIPQQEAIRITPIVHFEIEKEKKIIQIKKELHQDAKIIFEKFITEHIKNDDWIPLFEKNKPWKLVYPEIKKLFFFPNSLVNIYKIAREKFLKSRNEKIKNLCSCFTQYVEKILILEKKLHKDLENKLINYLRNYKIKPKAKSYKAKKRP